MAARNLYSSQDLSKLDKQQKKYSNEILPKILEYQKSSKEHESKLKDYISNNVNLKE